MRFKARNEFKELSQQMERLTANLKSKIQKPKNSPALK